MKTIEPTVVHKAASRTAPSDALKASALTVLGGVFFMALSGYYLAAFHLQLGSTVAVAAALLLLLIFAVVMKGLHHHGLESFGFANSVTAFRAAIVSLICAIIAVPVARSHVESTTLALIVFVLAALMLDGIDGHLARRLGQESDLGARFDMEVDALLILGLSAGAFLSGKAGLWVLFIGLMRYGFVLAQFAVPRLKAPLPASFRRKLVCVVQIVVLCLILLPGVVAPVSSWLGAIALLLLAGSFAADCLYLLRRREAME